MTNPRSLMGSARAAVGSVLAAASWSFVMVFVMGLVISAPSTAWACPMCAEAMGAESSLWIVAILIAVPFFVAAVAVLAIVAAQRSRHRTDRNPQRSARPTWADRLNS